MVDDVVHLHEASAILHSIGYIIDRLRYHAESGLKIDWSKVKEVICGIVSTLKLICEALPTSKYKSIICTISSLLELVCETLPVNQ